MPVMTVPDLRSGHEHTRLLSRSRVLTPQELAPLISLQQLPQWLEEQRAALLQQLKEERSARRAELAAECDALKRRAAEQAAAEGAAQLAAISLEQQRKARDLAQQMAGAVVEFLAGLFGPGGELAERYFQNVLRSLESQLDQTTQVVIHVASQDLPALDRALHEASPALRQLTQLRVDDHLAQGRCLLRTDERLVEADLGQWLKAVSQALSAAAAAELGVEQFADHELAVDPERAAEEAHVPAAPLSETLTPVPDADADPAGERYASCLSEEDEPCFDECELPMEEDLAEVEQLDLGAQDIGALSDELSAADLEG